MSKKNFVKRMFTDIAGDYDRLNRIISFNLDMHWRREAVAYLENPVCVLDICAGTGDMAAALSGGDDKPSDVVLADISHEILKLARRKLGKKNDGIDYHYVVADGERLPFKKCHFDSVTLGFSLRNIADLPAFLRELDRVTRENGKMVFLEIAHPEIKIVAHLFYFYFYKLVPFYSRIFTSRRYAYNYLPHSLKVFYKQRDFVGLLEECGYRNVSYKNILGGICAIYIIKK